MYWTSLTSYSSLRASSAEAERGFSQVKRVETDLRNRLKDTTLSDQLTIQLLYPSIEQFDPNPLIDIWYSAAARRPLIQPYVMTENSKGLDQNMDVESDSHISDYEIDLEDLSDSDIWCPIKLVLHG